MLIRTNPKLTGNIRLVVTEDYKMYLDGFKVSKQSLLNQTIYRKQAISDDGNYETDVYNVFKTLPDGEMYSLFPDSLDPYKAYTSLNEQIENIYEYGAEFNDDALYAENMHILAPLYIGKHLPTYFVVFRTDKLINDLDTDRVKQFT